MKIKTFYISFSLNEIRPMKEVPTQAPIVKVNKPPTIEPKTAAKAVVEKGRKLDEAELIKPNKVKLQQPTKPSLLQPHETVSSKKRVRSVRFDSDLSFRGSIVLLRAEMMKMETKSKTHLRRTLLKLEKERENNKSLIALHDAKVYEMEMEFEQQVL